MTTLIDEGTRLGGGRYVLQNRLGRGGAATVWLAEDTVLERPVAIKVLSEALASDENWLARFSREARMAAGLSHPNLVSVYDYDATGDRPYIVMAHMPGGSLWDRMQADERSDPHRLAVELLTALDAIHAAGIVHRDIKPGNVLFDAAGTACLTDFGVARPEDATSLTQTGQIPGTAKFMAPELWRGEPAGEGSDLFAAGVVLRDAIGPDAPAPVAALVDRLTAPEPHERPDSAGAALRELREAPAGAEPTPPRVLIRESSRSHRGSAIAGVALLGAIAAFALTQAIGGGDEPSSDSANETAAESEGTKKKSGGNRQASTAPQPAEDAGVDPVALDQQGKALIDAGRPEEAIPILQQAVDSYPEDSREINYAYSLYNLGNALLLAGRPAEAIPYLEQRMTFSDQRETVEKTLAKARKEAEKAEKAAEKEDDD